ncbi:MAG: AAA family ATPase [Myxococcota bacterium]|nr:AAA family ATPase [Myxococcota bacterium]
MAQVLAISNQKGGVGKTTTAVNLAACLAAAGQKILLIDLDPQGNASSGLGVDKAGVAHTIYEVIMGGLPLEETFCDTVIHDLTVAPANTDLVGAELELTSALAREHRLSDAVDAVRGQFDYVLIDCPPSLGLLTVNALTAADMVLVPLQAEYYALEGLGELTRTIQLIKQRLNPALSWEGVVLTLYDGRNRLSQQVEADVRDHLGDKVFQTIIPRNVRLGEAPSFGEPIITYDPRAKGAQAYRDLARELLDRGDHGLARVTRSA